MTESDISKSTWPPEFPPLEETTVLTFPGLGNPSYSLTLPARSRLYSLPPQGVGTPGVESLTGYITRLAEAHDIHPIKLLAYEILPLTEGTLIRRPSDDSLSTHLVRNGLVSNGMGEVAFSLVQALSKLTIRTDLHSLTMLAWSRVLAWEGLLRRTRAWCPACYDEQSLSRGSVYDQLLWALHAVTICPKHRQPLATTCPHLGCGLSMPVLAAHTRPGWCSRCEQWLGQPCATDAATYLNTAQSGTSSTASNPSSSKGAEDENLTGESYWQLWVAEALGELLAGAADLKVRPGPENIVAAIEACQRKLGYPSLRAFAMSRGPVYKTILGWHQAGHLPPVEGLLRLCYSLNTTPFMFLTKGAAIADLVKDNSEGLAMLPAKKKRQTKPKLPDPEFVRSYLGEVLRGNEYPPPSTSELGRRLGYRGYYLTKCFPEECREVTARYRAYVLERKAAAAEQLRARVLQAVRHLHEKGEYPSLVRMAGLLERPNDMRRPEAIATRKEVMEELGILDLR